MIDIWNILSPRELAAAQRAGASHHASGRRRQEGPFTNGRCAKSVIVTRMEKRPMEVMDYFNSPTLLMIVPKIPYSTASSAESQKLRSVSASTLASF